MKAGNRRVDMTSALWRDRALGIPRDLDLRQGRLRVFEAGSGSPIVFVHGFAVNANLWRKVVGQLAPDFRCFSIDLPLGSHTLPMPAADLSPPGLADLIADAASCSALPGLQIYRVYSQEKASGNC
jgi:pimeloyl-ACP methyl ester carboxylesterase